MGSAVIVGAEESGEGLASLLVGGVGAFVGPSLEEGLVEAFHFAVGLGTVGLDQFVSGADLGERLEKEGDPRGCQSWCRCSRRRSGR